MSWFGPDESREYTLIFSNAFPKTVMRSFCACCHFHPVCHNLSGIIKIMWLVIQGFAFRVCCAG